MFKCEVCGNEAKPWKRCKEHMLCDDCGTRDGVVLHVDGVRCRSCDSARVRDLIRDFDGDHEDTNEIVCPYCGYVAGDSWEREEGKNQCSRCENDFDMVRIVDVSYSTSKLGE